MRSLHSSAGELSRLAARFAAHAFGVPLNRACAEVAHAHLLLVAVACSEGSRLQRMSESQALGENDNSLFCAR